jgi:hypothetical protein
MLFWLLWLVVVVGGFYMAAGYGLAAYRNSFEFSASANALIYFVCAIYGLPKFVRFVLKR